MITPKQQYALHCQMGRARLDAEQMRVIEYLQALFETCIKKKSLKDYFFQKPLAKGLYIWGDVGSGKTYLMDLFFDALPFSDKQRLHFHIFMKNVHEHLRKLEGTKNPLRQVAKILRKNARVLCLDECHVNDIADAMLLRNLLEALLKEGVVLVTTSNVPPVKLYWNGLQRQQFLPAITLLETRLEVVHMNNAQDYRLHYLTDAGVYHTPLNQVTEHKMRDCFHQLAGVHIKNENRLSVAGRDIPVKGLSEDSVWFDFHAICGIPRCQRDYIVIAAHFKTVLVSNVVCIKADQRDLARSLINMVDVFYDAGTRLIVSASSPIEEIYPAGPLLFEFKRCISRLVEMRSVEYVQGRESNGTELFMRN